MSGSRAQVSECLAAIRQKEELIRAWVLDARRKSEGVVARARDQGEEMKRGSAEEAEAAAEAMFEGQQAEAEEEARVITEGIGEQVRALHEQSRGRMAAAVKAVMDAVLSQ